MFSPAKINLYLNILGKREDGYHELDSIFLKLSFGDDLEFFENDSGEISLETVSLLNSPQKEDFELVSEKGDFTKNILYKTFQKAKALKKIEKGVHIRLTKRIPTGGGLGGGSSNAATLLKYLFPERMKNPDKEFLQFAGSIGADVPFFLYDKNCIVRGIGEICEPLDLHIPNQGLLAVPKFSIPTKESFISLKKDLLKTLPSKSWKILNEGDITQLNQGNLSFFREQFLNEFENYAFQLHPILQELKQCFYDSGAVFTLMTGTGACVYSFWDKQKPDLSSLKGRFPEIQFISFYVL
ncbi:MAG TPA: 4-(cytidine 5'-diphospho)-2-C-methyl-D-erythritol kinase [Leptospiraceae bacterium]|nr:4-(cytidine 5'-diphospho)-2-C-methyl-D-erythritol kinase [Leptospiraceae bacterium]